jgi:hypothetical protein
MTLIKFRVWDKKNKCFEYWGHMEKGVFKSIPTGYSMGSIDEVLERSEKFTGLKNIYEGDRIYVSGVGICTVIWDKSILGFLFIEENTDDEYDYQDIIEEDLIVKGHIHE